MVLFAEVIFYAHRRSHLPAAGYRPDALFWRAEEYWGVTFVDLPVEDCEPMGSGSAAFAAQGAKTQISVNFRIDVLPCQ